MIKNLKSMVKFKELGSWTETGGDKDNNRLAHGPNAHFMVNGAVIRETQDIPRKD